MRPARHKVLSAIFSPVMPQSVSHSNAAEPGVARGTRRRGATATPVSRALLSPCQGHPRKKEKPAQESDLCWAGRIALAVG